MKRLSLRLFHLTMACIVLLSSTGFGLVEHTCRVRGKKVAIITVARQVGTPACAHCPQPAPSQKPTVSKDNCCKEDSRYENVDFGQSLSQLFAKFIQTVTEAITTGILAVVTYCVDWVLDRDGSASVALFPQPPPLSGRDILHFIQTLLI